MKIIITFLLVFVFHNVQESLPQVFSKLQGEWQRIGKPDNFEYWEVSQNSLGAENYQVTEGEKSILEKISIVYIDGSWYYVPDVPHNPAPVNFKITDISDTHFHSENHAHDFPKWIRYEFKGLDSLNVIIGDKTDSVYFKFIRFP